MGAAITKYSELEAQPHEYYEYNWDGPLIYGWAPVPEGRLKPGIDIDRLIKEGKLRKVERRS